jgi:hypothetical protein
MGVDVGPHLDLLDLDGLLLLARLGGLLLALIFQLAEIGYLADWRLGVGCYLDKVESGLVGCPERVLYVDNAVIVTLIVDELDPGNPDIAVGARSFLDRRRGFEWSANGRCLLLPLTLDR